MDKHFFRLLCTVIFAKFLLFGTVFADRERPNIVFILADDLGYHELGSFGQTRIKTPHLDQLAADGLRLTRHYSGSPVCAPSRCVLMTGKHPGHATVRNNKEAQPEGQFPLGAHEHTIAKALKAAGYATGAFGKWGLGPVGSTGQPDKQGFDRFFGYNCQRHAHSYYPATLWSDTTKIALENKPPVPGHAGLPEGADPNDPKSYEVFKGQDYAPDRINAAALDFLRAQKDGPFFLYYPTLIPHVALHVPDEELEPYLAQNWNDPPFSRARGYGYTPHFTPRAAYAAMITLMDRYIGRVLDLLDELKLRDNTLVVFSSDNGTTHLKAEVDYTFFESVGELRGLKGSLYEGGIRVPTIVRWPGKVPPGSVSDVQSGFEDWMPTLLAAAGLRAPENDGHNLLPALTAKGTVERDFLYREFSGYGGQQAVWSGPWKMVRQNLRRHNGGKPELYHLERDPSEKNNLASTETEVLARLSAIAEREHEASSVFPLPQVDFELPPKKQKQKKNAK